MLKGSLEKVLEKTFIEDGVAGLDNLTALPHPFILEGALLLYSDSNYSVDLWKRWKRGSRFSNYPVSASLETRRLNRYWVLIAEGSGSRFCSYL